MQISNDSSVLGGAFQADVDVLRTGLQAVIEIGERVSAEEGVVALMVEEAKKTLWKEAEPNKVEVEGGLGGLRPRTQS